MKALINIDNCHPDYFQGHHNRVFVAYYDRHTTVSDILEEIESDANSQEITMDFCNFTWSDFKKALKVTKEENWDNLQTIYMPDCDYSFNESDNDYLGEYEDGCAAYFTIVDSDTGE